MIRPHVFLGWLNSAGVDRFVGVPDSLLKNMLADIDLFDGVGKHVIAANEGAAVGYGVGSYLESGRPAAVYMQNSGLGNAVNPLTALAHKNVYGTPMVLIIGWRGEPGKPDEPQHVTQGSITEQLLDVLSIPYIVLDSQEKIASQRVASLLSLLSKEPQPVAILVPADTFLSDRVSSGQPGVTALTKKSALSREQALEIVLEAAPEGARIIVTTGMLGRELWESRSRKGKSSKYDFLVVGGMGHASAVAHGVAEANPQAPVWCLDGDGAMIMHMGTLAVVGQHGPRNLKHLVFNNWSHDSVGGQPTAASTLDFDKLSVSLGYLAAGVATNEDELRALLFELRQGDGPALLEVRVQPGARPDLGRPPPSIFYPGAKFPAQHRPGTEAK